MGVISLIAENMWLNDEGLSDVTSTFPSSNVKNLTVQMNRSQLLNVGLGLIRKCAPLSIHGYGTLCVRCGCN